jgi:hypothetical protein
MDEMEWTDKDGCWEWCEEEEKRHKEEPKDVLLHDNGKSYANSVLLMSEETNNDQCFSASNDVKRTVSGVQVVKFVRFPLFSRLTLIGQDCQGPEPSIC